MCRDEDALRTVIRKEFEGIDFSEFNNLEKNIRDVITNEIINIVMERCVSDPRFKDSDTPFMDMFEHNRLEIEGKH